MNVNDLYSLTEKLFNRQNATKGIDTVTSNGSAQTYTPGTYYAIQFITEVTPTVLTATNSSLATGVAYPAGTVLYCDITAITCPSGSIISLYKA